jgi:hypothetical protein
VCHRARLRLSEGEQLHQLAQLLLGPRLYLRAQLGEPPFAREDQLSPLLLGVPAST